MKNISVAIVTASGPNPWKVVWIKEELDLANEIESFGFEVVKKKPYIGINPNGRVLGMLSIECLDMLVEAQILTNSNP